MHDKDILESMIQKNYGPHAAPQTFDFPSFQRPLVSLIIPVFNKYQMTKECLYSILKHTLDVTYEVIIADDCSTDETIHIIDEIKGIKHVRTKTNMGFGGNCTNAIEHADGKYIALLNNDMLFYENWLKPIVDVLESDPTIGIAGATTFRTNGRLWELGSVITQSGEVVLLGKDLKYEPKKLIKINSGFDYKSGCSVVLSKNLWEKLGGFDPQFSPAYYEDTDLGMRVNQMGLKIVNVLESKIMHFESASYGDPAFSQKELCIQHAEKFMKKWAPVLNDPEHEKKVQKLILQYSLLKRKRKFFYKEKSANGLRHIYFFGIKILTYKSLSNLWKENKK